ncbi:hypothetical protein Dimus_000790 [Dionaea muscipula]
MISFGLKILRMMLRRLLDMGDENMATGIGMKLVVYRGDPTAQVQTERGNIHEHIEQVVRCILEGMNKQNKGITELSEHLELQIFTENQKEKLTYVKLQEIKTYLRNFFDELNNLSIFLKKTMLQVADLVYEKIKNQSTLIELKVEESGLDLTHLIEQKFLENDIKLKSIDDTANDVSKSQALLIESLLTFIEDAKKGERFWEGAKRPSK